MEAVPTKSVKVVSKEGVRGHLLLEGRRGIKGRVVDDGMLEALKAGCLRVGDHTGQAWYTLDRAFPCDEDRLREIGYTASSSDRGITLYRADLRARKCIVRCARAAVEGRLVYHRTQHKALEALHKTAVKRDAPTQEERLLVLSIGGNPNKMAIKGRFLNCSQQRDFPGIGTRCACGFGIAERETPAARQLLKRACNSDAPLAIAIALAFLGVAVQMMMRFFVHVDELVCEFAAIPLCADVRGKAGNGREQLFRYLFGGMVSVVLQSFLDLCNGIEWEINICAELGVRKENIAIARVPEIPEQSCLRPGSSLVRLCKAAEIVLHGHYRMALDQALGVASGGEITVNAPVRGARFAGPPLEVKIGAANLSACCK
ncbi:hypothetical protein ACHAXT_002756 [Thalassiosira profunda]